MVWWESVRPKYRLGSGRSGVRIPLATGFFSRVESYRWSGGRVSVPNTASGAENTGFESRLRRDFSGSNHTSDLKIGTPVATLPGSWRYRVSAGTGRPGVSIL